jgi:hypothetical protein
VKNATLSLVLPVYNAADNLATVVQDCLRILPRYFVDYEIIIVDDASRDNTLSAAYALAYTHDPVMVIHHSHRRGYGHALVNGFGNARGDYILSLNVHGPVHILELERMMPYIENYQFISGYRLTPPGSWSNLWSSILQYFANRVLTIDLRDINCRFDMLQAHMLEHMKLRMSSALIHAEIYARATQQGMMCLQVGVQTDTTRKTPSPAERWPGLRTLWELIWLWQNLHSSAPAEVARQRRRSFWQPRLIWAMGLVAVARGAWMLLRRR